MASDHENNRTHEPSLRELSAEFDGFKDLMKERHDRYTERDQANKESVRKAFEAAEKAAEKTEYALKEYKIGANEWRDTVKDLIASIRQKESEGISKVEGAGLTVDRIVQIVTFLSTLGIGIKVFSH